MRRILAFAFTIALAGCGKNEVDACEDFIQTGLRSPTTYKRVSVKTGDEKMSKAERLKISQSGVNGFTNEYEVRTVVIEYDAANAYGTPIRSQGMCMFNLYQGKPPTGDNLESSVRNAKLTRDFRGLAEAGEIANLKPGELREQKGPPCCL